MPHGSELPAPHVLRQTASDGQLGACSGRTLRSSGQLLSQVQLPGGGRSHGAIVPHPYYRNQSSTDLAMARTGYDASKHGWYDPRGLSESHMLATHDRFPDGSAPPGSWTWTMNKARNHIGAGMNGIMDSSDVSSTMVSGDSPDWFIGLRTVPGPFNCKAVPVRRCPKNYIEGKTLRVRARSYEQGACLDITEHLQDRSRLPSPDGPRRPRISEPAWKQEFRGPQVDGRAASLPATLVHGGCQIPAQRTYRCQTVTRERFDCGSSRSAGRQNRAG